MATGPHKISEDQLDLSEDIFTVFIKPEVQKMVQSVWCVFPCESRCVRCYLVSGRCFGAEALRARATGMAEICYSKQVVVDMFSVFFEDDLGKHHGTPEMEHCWTWNDGNWNDFHGTSGSPTWILRMVLYVAQSNLDPYFIICARGFVVPSRSWLDELGHY